MTKKEKILKDISLVYYIPLEVVEEVVDSQFKFIKDTISGVDREDPDSFVNIQVTHFGKFAYKPKKKRFYEKLRDNRDQDIE